MVCNNLILEKIKKFHKNLIKNKTYIDISNLELSEENNKPKSNTCRIRVKVTMDFEYNIPCRTKSIDNFVKHSKKGYTSVSEN